MGFTKLGLSAELLRGLSDLRFSTPTTIQKDAIPAAIEGRDVLACSMTGSGKTAAFGLPILQRLSQQPRGKTRALILTPTRELAAQIDEHLVALGKHTGVKCTAIYGGVGMGAQRHALERGVDIVVATPGRLIDHLENGAAKLNNIEILALDEADRMLDMGFLPDIKRILQRLPAKKQTLFFSATMPPEIVRLSKDLLHNPFTVQVERKAAPATGVKQSVYPVPQHLKTALLTHLIDENQFDSVLVFTRTKHRADRLSQMLTRKGIANARIHGDRTQSQRQQALKGFKAGRYDVLVATDVAARGIDVEALSHVINFDVPQQPEDYIHRVGRTARASATGDAFTFVASQEEGDLRAIERAINQKLERVIVEGFDYKQPAPEVTHRDGGGKRPRAWEERGGRGHGNDRGDRGDRQHRGSQGGHRGQGGQGERSHRSEHADHGGGHRSGGHFGGGKRFARPAGDSRGYSSHSRPAAAVSQEAGDRDGNRADAPPTHTQSRPHGGHEGQKKQGSFRQWRDKGDRRGGQGGQGGGEHRGQSSQSGDRPSRGFDRNNSRPWEKRSGGGDHKSKQGGSRQWQPR